MKHSTRLACISVILIIVFWPQNGDSCGPVFTDAVFTYESHPGAPLKGYAEGRLGIVLPTFDYSYLVVAYRYLQNRPLNKSEVGQAIQYWRWKLQRPYANYQQGAPDPVDEWKQARKLIAGTSGPLGDISTQRPFEPYASYPNCLADAFRNAVNTLKDRVQRFGADGKEVHEWLRGQDIVFSNCEIEKNIPPSVEANSPSWLKADRQYQTASAYFYAGRFDDAIAAFDRIGEDASSPWHVIAPYVAARAWIRKATLKNEAPNPDLTDLKEARIRLEKIMNDPTRSELHAAARKMLGFVDVRLDPERRSHQLAQRLSGTSGDPDFYQDMIDYGVSLYRMGGQDSDYWSEGDVLSTVINQPSSAPAPRKVDDLSDWLFTMRTSDRRSSQHALSRWQVTRSNAWLVAALSTANAKDKNVPDLLNAAEGVLPQSPAYPTIACHRVRLLMDSGKRKEALLLLNQVMAAFQGNLNKSSFNLFRVQRRRLAADFTDFLQYASLPVAGYDWDAGEGGDYGECTPKGCDQLLLGKKKQTAAEYRFDREGALILNLRMPVDLLVEASLGEQLPSKLRDEVALSTWTRAVMLGRHDIALKLVPALAKSYPAMQAGLRDYAAAHSDADRWHAALLLILRFPGVRPYVNAGFPRSTHIGNIDDFRDNWWCPDVGVRIEDVNFGKNESLSNKSVQNDMIPKHAPDPPVFLTPEQQSTAASEWHKLFSFGGAPHYLVAATLEWARTNPRDSRVPEALHLAIRAVRFGCDRYGNGTLSRRAFLLLHSRYSHSKWAKETPYWFR